MLYLNYTFTHIDFCRINTAFFLGNMYINIYRRIYYGVLNYCRTEGAFKTKRV